MKISLLRWILAAVVVVLTASAPAAAHAYWGAKYEPADGTIYSGFGQSTEAIVQAVNASDPDRQPMIVAAYDALTNPNNYDPNNEVMRAHNFYPGAILQVGMALPKKDAEELGQVSSGLYDTRIRQMADAYKNLNQDILLRIGFEFDGSWNGYDPTAYKNAFQHIVDLFRDEGADNVAFVWNASAPNLSTMFNWYPGDSYVDWFSFNVWGSFDGTWFKQQADAHSKPILIGESSRKDSTTWSSWESGFFSSLKSYGIKGYQYINWNWPVYPSWPTWSDGKYTHAGSTVVGLFNTEFQNSAYLYRDSSYFNPMALYVKATRASVSHSSINGTAWNTSYDEVAAQSGYGYSLSGTGALHEYSDGRASTGFSTYWRNASNTNHQTIHITVPSNSSGNVLLDGFAKYSDHTVTLGGRTIVSNTRSVSKKFAYSPSDITSGTITVTMTTPSNSEIRILNLGIQKVSSSAPAAPASLNINSSTSNSVSLSWSSVSGAELYNIYRDYQLVGTTTSTSFTDTSGVEDNTTYRYTVSAWHHQNGEGWMSTETSVTTPQDTNPVLTDTHEAEYYTLVGDPDLLTDSAASSGTSVEGLCSTTGNAIDFGAHSADHLAIHYAAAASGKISLYINGVYSQDINFPGTGGSSGTGNYGDFILPVTIPDHSILSIQCDSGDSPMTIDTIGYIRSSVDIEAEKGTILGSASIYGDSVASNGHGVAYLNLAVGNGVEFDNVSPANELKVRYASLNSGTLSLYVNGIKAQTINFPGTGAWTGTYAEITVKGDIPAGADIQLKRDSGDYWPNLDKIILISSEEVEAESATLLGSASVYNDSPLSGGSGVAYLNLADGNGIQITGTPVASTLKVRYSAMNSGTLSLYVNGSLSQQLPFTATSGWKTYYRTATFSVSIPENATVELKKQSTDVPINLDVITFVR